ncbi:site-specific DNA-methyltransferase [Xanthomonas hortorum pv. vitians]|uniref:site-specific DNA-methyltransferase n=1 Tax=Xanthomonas TaxID=338 RepID=UPI0007011E97|nr:MULTISPECIES: site-specific DNA-methyltransferase [Xanthomonas]KQR18543.1 DNA methyltransferase [Xanthomonas sp. Leaf148]MCE4291785.1 site-specific DNA-methyltransferase [Xanthomonas hortorum pv. vitians]MCE4296080.1 site-specific DNA-methyltransferase [Xanthomonas hortorum pv. vitians]MDT7854828.1 site-specific DNA-methyltransferase [Xanthomonas hortorum pv. vitians]NMI28646.1 site-specific DNA-methyltransferase [Xanthomonas hortorum pv. vitians]
MKYEELSRAALIKLLQDHDAERFDSGKDGIVLNYTGRTAPWQIARQVKPRMFEFNKRASVGSAEEECVNELWDGENLSTMVTLYKHRGQVDLVLTDPPYNTGEDFRYNDKWDKDPNDPDIGDLVAKDDGSRHSKWLRFMTPRLWMMREMLKPGGVIAICIDHRELYRLGMLMDEIFHEENRIGIINWQKSYAPRNDQKHISTATEYVLVYAKDIERVRTMPLPRTETMNSRYGTWDGDSDPWKPGDLTAPGDTTHPTMVYAIQSPFTGQLHYPSPGRHWATERAKLKKHLEQWGSSYAAVDLGDGHPQAFLIKGAPIPGTKDFKSDHPVLIKALKESTKIRESGPWPKAHWRDGGQGTFGMKKYLKDVKRGIVPTTYWSDDDYDSPMVLDGVSWDHTESGHSQAGVNELTAVVGKGHNFRTVKPLRLMKKIMQIWCKPDGIVMDPFAGSGTTGHAVLELNKESGSNRRFILIEQGNDEKGDHYAKTLTADRIKRAITGKWKSGDREPLGGGFRYFTLKREKVDANAVNALAREEMMDLLLVSYWDRNDKAKSYLRRLPAGDHKHLFAVNSRNEGFFLVWSAPDQPSTLTRAVFKEIVQEAKTANLAGRYHVYAALAPYTGNDIEFYQIPDKVLEHIGFNARADAYNNDGGMDAD